MKEVFFEKIFEYKKKSKIKAGEGLKLGEGDYPFFTSSNTLSKSIDNFLFEKPSLIFGTGGMPSVHYCEKRFSVSTDCLVAQPRKNVSLHIPYFYYFFSMNDMRILQDGFKGAGLKHISRKYIDKIKIPLPTIETQKRIAAILDDAAALRDKTQQLLTEYDQLAQSIFLEMFGDPGVNPKKWENKKCGEYIDYLADIGSNGANKTISEKLEMSDEEDYALMIRTTNFTKNDFENNVKFVSKDIYDFFKKSQIFGGEIIMNKIGSAGDFWLMPDLNRPVSLGLNQFVIRLKNIETIYFYYFLSTDFGRINIQSRTNGAATKSITKTAVRDLPILVPPIELQNQFAEKIALIEKQKDLATQELKESEDFFNCLLQKAFKGELV